MKRLRRTKAGRIFLVTLNTLLLPILIPVAILWYGIPETLDGLKGYFPDAVDFIRELDREVYE